MKYKTELTLYDAPVTVEYNNGGYLVYCGGEDVTDSIGSAQEAKLHMEIGEKMQEDMIYDDVGTLVPLPLEEDVG